MQTTHQTVPAALIIGGLAVYCLVVLLMFRKDKLGFRRRWLPLDYVWVPLGGLTVASLLALWWKMR